MVQACMILASVQRSSDRGGQLTTNVSVYQKSKAMAPSQTALAYGFVGSQTVEGKVVAVCEVELPHTPLAKAHSLSAAFFLRRMFAIFTTAPQYIYLVEATSFFDVFAQALYQGRSLFEFYCNDDGYGRRAVLDVVKSEYRNEACAAALVVLTCPFPDVVRCRIPNTGDGSYPKQMADAARRVLNGVGIDQVFNSR
jgi:hypothetical protein